MLARSYVADQGRFAGVDPSMPLDLQFEKYGEFVIFERRPQSWNKYVYASDNPICFRDPDGANPLVVVAAPLLPVPGVGEVVGVVLIIATAAVAVDVGVDLYNSYTRNRDLE